MRAAIYDLQDRAQLERYVQQSLILDINQAYELRHMCEPFAVVIAKVVNGRACNVPHPIVVGHARVSSSRKAMDRAIKGTVRDTQAHGVFVVAQMQLTLDGRKQRRIVVQLEHRVFGDLVWHAEVLANSLGLWEGPKELGGSEIRKTAFLPERWMM